MTEAVFHLRAGGVSVVVATSDTALPVICHWGRDLGPLDAGALARVTEHAPGTRVTSEPDRPLAVGVLPEPKQAWMGPPGLTGDRDGAAGFPDFDAVANEYERVDSATVAQRLIATATDAANGLALRLEFELLRSGLLRTRAVVRNDGAGRYRVDGLDLALPVPGRAVELLDFSGRHGGERRPQRSTIVDGTHLREQRRGRPGPDSATLLVAGTADFGFARGEVWAVHLGWSGNARLWAHRTNGGRTALGGGELLLPGEVMLGPGEEYETPWLYAAHGEGLDDASARIHEALRARPVHPAVGRPVTLNTWEAVYFDHTLAPLHELAALAADVGVERFVLDDGWFLGRRHDRAGLGDWTVDPAVWPNGLTPLVERVRELGMQFGIWFEPEMINPDSELARAHPDWVLAPLHRDAPLARQQLVLNVGDPDARAHLRDRIVDVVTAHRIDYIKWDHNRDLVEPVDRASGRAGVHRQTRAVYELMHEIRAACPWLEIESCSAGGGRIDLGIVERTDRFWTSDSNDPLERQRIQRWTSLLMPPELLGAHVGAATAHVTGRSSSIDFRAITSMVGSFGIEWDIREATADERASLAGWIAEFVRLRPLIERGRIHRLETEPSIIAQTVVSTDRAHAIATIATVDSPAHLPGAALRLTGLDPEAAYRVTRVRPEASVDPTTTRRQPDWWTEPGIWPGIVLAEVGLPMPILRPQEAGLIELVAQ
ncbi:alpha-galactosidase [Agromyces fucosus]|uniref:Alpha-galactosidase n=1 Tax=Agromyces fucosus TaxID=41985 RepID=A0A4Q2JRZ1_9MICO|nr:alpha-galactosidase [Agromyces fucosus]RXZ51121.1 alpha-galactosidase [Agromyces fucosus]